MSHDDIPYAKDTHFECEIRTTDANSSHDGEASGFTITSQDHHEPYDTRFHTFGTTTIYVEDTHDEAFDLEIQSTAAENADYTGRVSEQTISIAAGDDTAKIVIDGPVGRISYRFGAGGTLAAAPTAGSCRVVTHATL